MRKKYITLFLSLFAVVTLAFSQNSAMRFNEIVTNNENGLLDEYGQRSAWIELYNTSYGIVNLQGCYLTNDKAKPTKFSFPKKDPKIVIEPRQYIVFYADGKINESSLHLPFTIKAGESCKLFLFDANAINIIDSVTVPVLGADVAYARAQDGLGKWEIKKAGIFSAGSANFVEDDKGKINRFKTMDPDGLSLTIIAMSIVFCVLVLLSVFFTWFKNTSIKMSKKREAAAKGLTITDLKDSKGGIKGAESAAISMALKELYNDEHDIESTILTIHKTRRSYSPWNSKIYGVQQNQNLRKK